MTAPAALAPVVIRGFTVYADGAVVGPSGRVLKPCADRHGYLYVNRRDGRRIIKEKVHRLMAEAFHGPAPTDKPLALHRDGDPLNNRAENLYWGDHRDNSADAARHGTAPAGEAHGQAKLTRLQVEAIRAEYLAGGVTQAELGRRYGVSQPAISLIVRGRNWKGARP